MASAIEQSELRENIEQMILNGKSLAQTAEWAKQNGLDISSQAVKRHKDKYGIVPTQHTYNSPTYSGDGDDGDDYSALHIEPPNVNTGEEAVKYARETAQQIYCNQFAIVKAKQQAYMEGNGRYPHVELMGLKNMLSVLGAMTDKKDAVINVVDKDTQKAAQEAVTESIVNQIRNLPPSPK